MNLESEFVTDPHEYGAGLDVILENPLTRDIQRGHASIPSYFAWYQAMLDIHYLHPHEQFKFLFGPLNVDEFRLNPILFTKIPERFRDPNFLLKATPMLGKTADIDWFGNGIPIRLSRFWIHDITWMHGLGIGEAENPVGGGPWIGIGDLYRHLARASRFLNGEDVEHDHDHYVTGDYLNALFDSFSMFPDMCYPIYPQIPALPDERFSQSLYELTRTYVRAIGKIIDPITVTAGYVWETDEPWTSLSYHPITKTAFPFNMWKKWGEPSQYMVWPQVVHPISNAVNSITTGKGLDLAFFSSGTTRYLSITHNNEEMMVVENDNTTYHYWKQEWTDWNAFERMSVRQIEEMFWSMRQRSYQQAFNELVIASGNAAFAMYDALLRSDVRVQNREAAPLLRKHIEAIFSSWPASLVVPTYAVMYPLQDPPRLAE